MLQIIARLVFFLFKLITSSKIKTLRKSTTYKLLFLLTVIFSAKPFTALTQCTSFITSFPYNEDFEINNGGWTTGQSGSVLSDWTWGQPSKTYISNAASGNKCWITGGLSGNFYKLSELSWLKTPCFNFSTLQKPMISFKIYWETELNYDGAILQYSTNAGTTWTNIGAANEPVNCVNKNWYNTTAVRWLTAPLVTTNNGWSGSHNQTGTCSSSSGSLGWVNAQHSLDFLGGAPSVIFRFVFGAGSSCNDFNGIAIDSVYIGETPNLPLPLFASINPVCQGDPAPVLPSSSTNGANGTWNPAVSTANPGTNTYTFTPASGQCFSSTTQNIIVHPLPTNVSAGPTLSTTSGVGIMLQGSAPTGMTYQWSPSTGLSNATILNPIASPLQNTTYTLQVTNSFGCKTTATTFVTITTPPPVSCSIEPSRIFTPNNDGYYDKWIVYNGNCIKSVDASVYNRWGGLVYHSNHYQNDWDGSYNNKSLPDATYYYVLKVIENSGKSYILKGNVTIKR